ncbi:MAG TPA: RluA family pseudouridine synthase [Hyphomicrobium sp.]|nr:RluA family pseudouridine synthase [Hyphomicrobium sp.]
MTFEVAESEASDRLDRWLAAQIPELSRGRIQALIKDGHVTRDGRTIVEPNTRVKPAEVYGVALPDAAPSDVAGEEMPLNVVFEDQSVIVIDKPAGLVVHPAAGHASGTLVNALIAHCGDSLSGIGGVKRPGIVHRLDKDTSGLLVVAKTDAAHQSLSEQFRSHGEDGRLHRAYLALVWGVPVRPKGVIDAALARSTANRTKIAVSRHETARHAVTHYEVLETFTGVKPASTVSLLRLILETGRTHQIRVHLAHIGHPVLGDPVYGTGFKTRESSLNDMARPLVERLRRQALHAEELGFEHPKSAKPKLFKSPLPVDMAKIIDALQMKSAVEKKANSTDRRAPKRSHSK